MNIYTGLLFQQGFIQDSNLALALGGDPPAPPVPQLANSPGKNPNTGATASCNPYRRGAIAAVCSIALSPFR